MDTFDLSQALDDSPEPCCSDTTDVQDEIINLYEGLDLVVSRNLKTMRGVANLLLAVNRMKKPPTRCGWKLNDGELCSAIMDSVVEETIVKTVVNCYTGQKQRVFHRLNSGNECTLCDISQKDVVCTSGELKLQAITLKGGYSDRKVHFKVARYATVHPDRDDDPVVLSIKKHNLHISCSMNGGTAVLNLEKCSGEHLKRISIDGDMERFLFFKRTKGISLNTFESVKCPGWFISTSSEDENQPLEMCIMDTAHRNTSFKIN